MRSGRAGLSSVYGFIVIFTLLMVGIGAALTITDSQAAIWNAQDRARQVQAAQRAERLTLSLNGTSLTVRNDGLIPSSLSYLHQKGASTSTDRRIGSSLQEGSNMTIPVTAGMSSFAIITSVGNVFWVHNSTQSQTRQSTVAVTFDASGLDPSFGPDTIVTVDGLPYLYSSMPKTFEWNPGSLHSYSFVEGFAAGTGSRVGWSYARGLSSTISGTVAASQPGTIVSGYTQQYLLTVKGGNVVQYIGSPSSDGWYNAGSSAQVTTNHVWNLSAGQSRQSLVSWALDGGTNQAVNRVGSGTFTTTQIIMNAIHTVGFNSVTQYYVTVGSGLPSSGSVPAVSTSYSYTSVVVQSWTQGSPCSVNYIGTYYCINPSPGGSQTPTALTSTVAVTVSGTPGDTLSIYTLSFNNECSNPDYSITSSGTYSGSHPCGRLGVGQQLYWGYIVWLGCTDPNTGKSVSCGTTFAVGTGSGTWSYSSSTSGSQSTATNSYSVSGSTVTYTYGIGYTFPAGSTSTSWSTTWPSTESYRSNSCSGASVSGNTIYGTSSCFGSLVTTGTGTTSATLGASPTSDGWYDSGSGISIGASASGPFVFSSWSSSNSVSLPITSASSAPTMIQVNTYGTVTAYFGIVQ